MADYFRDVAAIPAAQRRKAYEAFVAWQHKESKTRPAKVVCRISANKKRQEALLKFLGLVSIAGPHADLLQNPNLRMVQMIRRSASDRIVYANMIKHILKRVRGRHACVGELHQVTKDNLLQVIMVRGKLGGDSEYGSNFVASVAHVFDDLPPEIIVYTLAFKQMPMSTTTRKLEFQRKYVMQELKITEECTRLVEQEICPNLPIVYDWWECRSCTYWNPKLKRAGVPKSCLMMANELSTGGDLKGWITKGRAQTAWKSCIFQILAGLVAFHNLLGYHHDDLHYGNVLYDAIKPGGFWHYRFMTSPRKAVDVWIPNTGQLWKLWDFGLASKVDRPRSLETRQELACDAMRILGILADPHVDHRRKPMPSRAMSRMIAGIVDRYEDTGICNEDRDIDEEELWAFDFKYTPAFEIMMMLDWFFKKPPGTPINEKPYTMNVY